jgi:hypothetical protein
LSLSSFWQSLPPCLRKRSHPKSLSKARISRLQSKLLTQGRSPNYDVWSGPGTSSTGTRAEQVDGFIVDWSRAVTEPPKGLQRYEVSFYAKLPDERLIYVVFYEYDPASGDGYIYLPGRTEQWYRLDVSTIFRGVEGKWFRASKLWEGVARPLIAGAEVTVLSTGPDHSRQGAPNHAFDRIMNPPL